MKVYQNHIFLIGYILYLRYKTYFCVEFYVFTYTLPYLKILALGGPLLYDDRIT